MGSLGSLQIKLNHDVFLSPECATIAEPAARMLSFWSDLSGSRSIFSSEAVESCSLNGYKLVCLIHVSLYGG